MGKRFETVKSRMAGMRKHPLFTMWTKADAIFALVLGAVWAKPALAQLSTVTSTVTLVCTTIKTVTGAIFFIALCWAAFEMVFGKHEWKKAILVLAGGTIIGAAGTIASALGVTGTSC